jgi:hypothetical protein
MSQYTKDLAKANAVGKGGSAPNLPDRGTRTGLNGDTYGANISPNATNSTGSFKGNSAPADECCHDTKC